MGRKIPGKKFKKIKDPEKQHEARLDKIKGKINNAPKNPDNQAIPKSLLELMHLKNKCKNMKAKPKRKNKKSKLIKVVSKEWTPNTSKGNRVRLAKTLQQTPKFIQQNGESDEAFMKRVNYMVDDIVKEVDFENKYDVTVTENEETGEVYVDKREEDELELLVKNAKKQNKKKKRADKPRLTKSQKWQQKVAEKKVKKQEEKLDEFEKYKDTVKFGEVVHRPPTLVTPKKAAKLNCASRPGKKDLLLKSVLSQEKEKRSLKFPITTKKSVFDKISAGTKIDKKGKRKDLPVAVRRQLDTQREEIVNAYKMLKAKKASNL